MSHFQRTLKRTISFSGIGVHSGQMVSVEVRPAIANTGIVFQRVDLPSMPYICASPDQVYDTSLATRIGTPKVHVSTVEHIMAAFFGFGIDNAIVSLNNFEMPILDGSAAPFLILLDEAGVQELKTTRKIVIIHKTIEIIDEKNPSRFIRIEPSKKPRISYAIDFNEAEAIGRQQVSFEYSAKTFCEEFSFARTFCLKEEIDYMRSCGLAKGGSMENALVVSKKEGVLNTRGLRSDLEFVKHKVLDCIGDLHLVGMPILGHVIAYKAGHDLHTKLAKAILQQTSFRTVVEPTAKNIAAFPAFKDLLSFPKSLVDIDREFVGLAIG